MEDKFLLQMLAAGTIRAYSTTETLCQKMQEVKQDDWASLRIPGMDVGGVFNQTRIGNALDEMSHYWTPMRARFISAGTGAGKSTFLNHVIRMARTAEKPEKVLILVNRTALKKSTIMRLAKKLRLDSDVKKQFESNSRLEIVELEYITVMTYQAMVRKVLKEGFRNDSEYGYAYVCFEEAHFFTSDSCFNELTDYALGVLVNTFHNAVRIYLTATEVEVLPYIARAERELLKKKLKNFDTEAFLETICTVKLYRWLSQKYPFWGYTEYNCKTMSIRQSEYRQPSHFYQYLKECEPEKFELWKEAYYNPGCKPVVVDMNNSENNSNGLPEDFYWELYPWKMNPLEYLRFERDFSKYELFIGSVDTVSEGRGNTLEEKNVFAVMILLEAIPKGDKVIAFAETQDQCEKIVAAVKDSRKAVAMSRDLVDAKNSKAVEELQNIVTKEQFEANVLCTTKYIDNGVNINDAQVKYVILLMTDITDILQCLGRVRIHVYESNEKVRVIFLVQPEELHRGRINKLLEESRKKINVYFQTTGTLGEMVISELPKDTFLSVKVEYIPEEIRSQIEAAKLLGTAYSKIEQVLATSDIQKHVELKYNTIGTAKTNNQLFMYEYLTDLKLTGDVFEVNEELPFPENFYSRYYDLVSDIIPASVIRPIEKFLQEQDVRLLSAKEAEEERIKKIEEEFKGFLQKQAAQLLNCEISEIIEEREIKILNEAFEECRDKIYEYGEKNTELQKRYPEIKKLKSTNQNSTGQTELAQLLTGVVMASGRVVKIGNKKEGMRIITVTKRLALNG